MPRRKRSVNRREFLTMAGSGAAGVMMSRFLRAPAMALGDEPGPRKPNIIVILVDDLGYADDSFHGSKEIPTPHIDSLAVHGMRFTDGYCSAPVCCPSRSGILTGRYQQRFGMEYNSSAASQGLPAGENTIADLLKSAGYVTGIVGKWHQGPTHNSGNPIIHPMDRGFDEYFGFIEAWHYYLDPPDGRGIYRDRVRITGPRGVLGDFTPDVLADEAVAFIQRHKDEPFFLYFSHMAPHTDTNYGGDNIPLHATEKYLSRFPASMGVAERRYAAIISALDDGVGQVLSTLKTLGLEEDTLIFYLSDNGGAVPSEIPYVYDNFPLKGSKARSQEGGIRVPFVAQWKGHISRSVCRVPIISLDICRTALAVAGAEPPTDPDHLLDGVNLLPLLTGQTTQLDPRDLFWRMGSERAVRRGEWKLVNSEGSGWELYKITEDIGEKSNLAAQNAQLVQELTAAFNQWQNQL